MTAPARHRPDSRWPRLWLLVLCGCATGQSGTDTRSDEDCPFDVADFRQVALDQRIDSLGVSAREIYDSLVGVQPLERCGAEGVATLTLEVARGASARFASRLVIADGMHRRCEQLRVAVTGRLRSDDAMIDRAVSEAVISALGLAQFHVEGGVVEYDFRGEPRTADARIDGVHYVSSERQSECSACQGRTPQDEEGSALPACVGDQR